jgi:hypothetical protein
VLDGEIGGPPQPDPETMNVSASSRLITLVGDDTSCSADTPQVTGAALGWQQTDGYREARSR